MMSKRDARRRAGLLIPLFSCASTTSWGIGEICDLEHISQWLAEAGVRVLQLLPLNEMAPGQQSPYSAITAMAIDPIYIHVASVPDFVALGGEASLDRVDRELLEQVRAVPRVDYGSVRTLKNRALAASFRQFLTREWCRGTSRARALEAYAAAQAWWLDDYALFRAIHARENERAWTEWPEPLRDRRPDALAEVRLELADDILFHKYLQWVADSQWQAGRAAANANGISLFGDLPFMVDGDSADVWAHQPLFMLDASVGVPPDAFSVTGQDWGMPVYRWDAVAEDDFSWIRDRARRSAQLYDGYRVDHLVGFYRTYGRPRAGGPPFFIPADEPSQTLLGERVLEILREPGTEIIAEDLGTVPDFVRASLVRTGVPGFRVARWERAWQTAGHPFKDPADYPRLSVAASGTHDTEPMAVWWDQAPREERILVSKVPTVARLANGIDLVDAPYHPVVRDVLLEALFASGSDLLLMAIQDVFGWRDRVNEPATVNDVNWTYRLPWPSDRLNTVAAARQRRDVLHGWAREYRRL
jgi:4-alpha-glucanotransferase